MKTLRELYQYREMLFGLVRRDLRGRYKGSFLGFAWTFLNPLLQLAVYTLVFSYVLPVMNVERYYLFLFVALIPWIAMSASVTSASVCITGQSAMVTKIYFPRLILPIATVTTNFVNMLLGMLVVFLVCALSIGIRFTVLWYLIPTILIEYILALGLAFLVSCLTVYFRDMEHFLPILVLAWQFLSPVMYAAEMVPERFRTLFFLNPMTPILTAYRKILYEKAAPDPGALLFAFGISLLIFVAGALLFSRLERHFAEEL